MAYLQHPTHLRVLSRQLNLLSSKALARRLPLLRTLYNLIINLRAVLPSIPMGALAIMILMAVKSCVKRCSLLMMFHMLALLSIHMLVNMILIKNNILPKRNHGFRLPRLREDALVPPFLHQPHHLLNHYLQHLCRVLLTRRSVLNTSDTGEMALGGLQGWKKKTRVQQMLEGGPIWIIQHRTHREISGWILIHYLLYLLQQLIHLNRFEA